MRKFDRVWGGGLQLSMAEPQRPLFSPSLNLVEAETEGAGSCDFIAISAVSARENRTMSSSQGRLILGPVGLFHKVSIPASKHHHSGKGHHNEK